MRTARRPFEVLHLVQGLPAGGVAEHVLTLVRKGTGTRYRSRVVVVEEPGVVGRELRALGFEVTAFGHRGPPRGPRADLLLGLVRLFRRDRAAVVYTHGYHPGLYGRLAARVAGVPAIMAQHHEMSDRWHRKRNLFNGWLAGITDRIVVGSTALRQNVLGRSRIRPEKVRVIPYCVDPERFQDAPPRATARRALGLDEASPVVGFVGRLVHRKGVSILLEAMRRVADLVPGARLVVVGTGPEEERLRVQATSLGLDARVHFLGLRRDIPTILAALDVFAGPSLIQEVFGIVFLEAGVMGLPVVASRLDGIPEVVLDGETGILVPPGDPAALADAVGDLLEDRSRAEGMGKRGRDRVLSTFTADRLVGRIEALYTEVLEGKGLGVPGVGDARCPR